MLKEVKALSILGVSSRFTTLNAPLMKKIVITFIDLPYVLLLQCKYISNKNTLQAHFNQYPPLIGQIAIFFNKFIFIQYKFNTIEHHCYNLNACRT